MKDYLTLKIEHQELQHKSDEKQYCLGRIWSRERVVGGLDVLGGGCPQHWKSLPGFRGWDRVLLWLGSGFHFACSLFAFPHVDGARVSLLALPGDPLSLATFSLPAKLCPAIDCKYSCPEVSGAVYLYALSVLSSVSLC